MEAETLAVMADHAEIADFLVKAVADCLAKAVADIADFFVEAVADLHYLTAVDNASQWNPL